MKLNEEEISIHAPKVAVLNEYNQITQMIHEVESEVITD